MRRYLVFVAASFGLLMYAIDSTAVAVAFPPLIKDLHTTILWAGWTISIYFIGLTVATPLAGKLSDGFGRKKIFLASLFLFTGSSLACGFAPNIYTLIIFRFIQGIGGAGFNPSAAAMVSDHFPHSRQTAIGLFTSVFNTGTRDRTEFGGWIVSSFFLAIYLLYQPAYRSGSDDRDPHPSERLKSYFPAEDRHRRRLFLEWNRALPHVRA